MTQSLGIKRKSVQQGNKQTHFFLKGTAAHILTAKDKMKEEMELDVSHCFCTIAR